MNTPTITIYSTPTCTYCHAAKEYLKSKGVAFNDVNVAGDPAKVAEMIEKSGQRGVPVIDIDGDIMVGYDESELAAKLGL